MKYNHAFNIVVSAYALGIIDYWEPNTLQFPDNEVKFKYKRDTDLFLIIKCKTALLSRTGKLRRVYDESLENARELQKSDVSLYRLKSIDFGQRMAVEKEIENIENVPQSNSVFDDSSNFIIYPTLLAIKSSKKVRKISAAAANVNESKELLTDTTLLCCAFKKHIIYIFMDMLDNLKKLELQKLLESLEDGPSSPSFVLATIALEAFIMNMVTAMWKAPLGCGKHNDQPDLGCQQFQMGCQSAGLEGKEEEAVIWALEKKEHYAPRVSEFALPSPLLGSGAGGICRLRSGVKFSADEERLLIELRGEFGKKWARKATYFDRKNR
ncbi:hypothetical protein Tco_0679633 [Tanacetum coccineum]|uniref:Uncharacterized protein n=1 Tax=Tanacetum coccineum TaxID=301880 RepID=A0ABQ4XIM8_9ASTR